MSLSVKTEDGRKIIAGLYDSTDVTQAKELGYDNSKTGIEADNIQDAFDQVFTYVGDKKQLMAEAIIDKGSPISSAVPSFDDLITGIQNIPASAAIPIFFGTSKNKPSKTGYNTKMWIFKIENPEKNTNIRKWIFKDEKGNITKLPFSYDYPYAIVFNYPDAGDASDLYNYIFIRTGSAENGWPGSSWNTQSSVNSHAWDNGFIKMRSSNNGSGLMITLITLT